MAENADDYARKSYRYLRIAIVAMVLALLVSVFFEYLAASSLLNAISAYYYTPVNPLFVGALVMIGICLIAIRGATVFEEVVLNLAGMLAPVVALVPTAAPAGDGYGGTLYDIPIASLTSNTVWAAAIAAVVAVLGAYWVASRLKGQDFGRAALGELARSTKIGFMVAGVGAGALVVIYLVWDSQTTHNSSAIGMFAGLWAVATASAVRHAGGEGPISPKTAWLISSGGTLAALGAALLLAAAWRLAAGASLVWILLIVGVALLAAVSFIQPLRGGAQRYYAILKEEDRYARMYLLIALWMLTVGALVQLSPGEFPQRTFWLEVVELVPFAVFWTVQTIERWNDEAVTFNFGSS